MIEPKYESNVELAEAYERFARKVYKDPQSYRMAVKKAELIEDAEVRIPEIYRSMGTLQGATLAHIGTATLGLLEELLARGEEEVISDYVALRSRGGL